MKKSETDEAVVLSVSFKHGKEEGRLLERALRKQRALEARSGTNEYLPPMGARTVYDRMVKKRKMGEKKREMEYNMRRYGKPSPSWGDKLSNFLDELTAGDVE